MPRYECWILSPSPGGTNSEGPNRIGKFLYPETETKLQYEELHNLYSSPSIIRMIKSRRMGWIGHVA
jgi:hypothetical protein